MINRLLIRLESISIGSMVSVYRANKIVNHNINASQEEDYEGDERLQHSIESLNEELSASISRLERIENKAMNTTVGVTLAFVLFGAISGVLGSDGLLAEQQVTERILASVLLLISMTMFFLSGMLAYEVFRIGQSYSPQLNNRMPIVNRKDEAKAILYCIEQNWRESTKRANLLSASFLFLRNALIIAFFLGLYVIVVVANLVTVKWCV